MLNDETMAFARQCGATHAVVHLVDYNSAAPTGSSGSRDNQPVDGNQGWGGAGATVDDWTPENLIRIKEHLESHGLEFYAIENFDPLLWHDVLLDGPKRDEQLEGLQEIIRILGRIGIPVMGYNFSIGGVAGRTTGRYARGGAESVGMEGVDERPIPLGMVWNMIYDPAAPAGELAAVSSEELWRRLAVFLDALLPVAEESGVRLAAHPDDPPVSPLRGQPRLVYRPELYRRLLDIHPSRSNALEFCVGTIAEMAEGDVYEATDRYSAGGHIAYVHLRNVRGKAPHYREVFIDEGDLDVRRVIDILARNHYDGVVIPDHTPLMSCDAPWHAGMAYAVGYIRGLLERSSSPEA